MKSKTKVIISSISFFVMIATLPIMEALNNYYLMVADLILAFVSAFSFVFFGIFTMFPNKREKVIARAEFRKFINTWGGNAGGIGGLPQNHAL